METPMSIMTKSSVEAPLAPPPPPPNNTSSESTDTESGSPSQPKRTQMSISTRLAEYMQRDIDSKKADFITIYACFLNGFTSAHSFSACYVWCGFQTGNVAQLGIAVARNFNPRPYRTDYFEKLDQQALCALLSFLVGTSFGRIGDKMGPKKRSWLVLSSFLQALMAMAAALAAHFSGQTGIAPNRANPSWTNALGFTALGFLAASLGLQGIIGKRVGSPLNTTIVLTTTWVELINDPFLFAFRPVTSRDVRASGIFTVFIGAFTARAIIPTAAGAAGSIGVLVALRLIQVVWWALLPAAPPKK